MDREFFNGIFNKSTGYLGVSFKKGEAFTNKYYQLPVPEAFYSDCEKASAMGYDCYFVPSVLKSEGRKKSDFKESNVVWMDYDNATVLPDFKDLIPTTVIESSPAKFHVYWNIDKSLTLSALEAINKGLNYEYGGDKSGVDATQLLRVPGTMNYKYSEPKPVAVLNKYPVSYGALEFLDFLEGYLLLSLNSAVKNLLKLCSKYPTILNSSP